MRGWFTPGCDGYRSKQHISIHKHTTVETRRHESRPPRCVPAKLRCRLQTVSEAACDLYIDVRQTAKANFDGAFLFFFFFPKQASTYLHEIKNQQLVEKVKLD